MGGPSKTALDIIIKGGMEYRDSAGTEYICSDEIMVCRFEHIGWSSWNRANGVEQDAWRTKSVKKRIGEAVTNLTGFYGGEEIRRE